MTNFLVNLLSPIFTSLGVSVADLTSYIERLSGYIIAILVAILILKITSPGGLGGIFSGNNKKTENSSLSINA